jgi:ech hydrogenase subunit D
MKEQQEFIKIKTDDLLKEVKKYKDDGFRLVQIGATTADGFELNYSFDKEAVIKSVSGIYWNAFLYENEISDLFGIKIEGIAVDYGGNFYRTSVKSPFGEGK